MCNMPFFKAGDVTAPKLLVKASLRWLAEAKMFFTIFLLNWCAKHT